MIQLKDLYRKRKKWVEANRENNFESGIKRLLTDLYPDNAHFIYELLQNAEDAKATSVKFDLRTEEVIFEHNGERLFSIDDVDAITSIGISTKKDDHTSIGKFGVGFKAVYSYTKTPEILSGDYHFSIKDMVVPEEVGSTQSHDIGLATRIRLPFDNDKKNNTDAQSEIEENLCELDESTLLFLSNIDEIEYSLPDGSSGYLKRQELSEHHIAISIQHPNESEATTYNFLRFQKKVDIKDENEEIRSCLIAVAFKMVQALQKPDSSKSQRKIQSVNQDWTVKPLDRGRVFIYFPAEKETSNLKFHLHAPFASTVARDSIRDCEPNDKLGESLAELVSESMTIIRDTGLLDISFLATLPNIKDNLPPFYETIQDKLITAFREQELTPMKSGGHAAASGIFRGTAQLSSLIDDDDLATILGEDYFAPMWVANPPQRNQREDNFLESLDIPQWTITDFVDAFQMNEDVIHGLLENKSLEWHQRLYAYLGDQIASSSSYSVKQLGEQLRQLEIIRTYAHGYVMGKDCYFQDDSNEVSISLPRVDKGVYESGNSKAQQESAHSFLERVGVRKLGEVEQVEAILSSRYQQDNLSPRIQDIKRFIRLFRSHPDTSDMFARYCIFKSADGDWVTPSQIYLDEPFQTTGLTAFFEVLGDDTSRKGLSNDYMSGLGIDLEELVTFAKATGAADRLEIQTVNCYGNKHWQYLNSDWGNRYATNANSDYIIEQLDEALAIKSIDLSRLVWNTMRGMESEYFWATYNVNWHQDNKTAKSQLICLLEDTNWIPQKNGDFVKPADALRDELPAGFPFDEGEEWLQLIEFGKASKKSIEDAEAINQRAKEIGFDSADDAETGAQIVQLLKEGGTSPEEFLWDLKRKTSGVKPTFPSHNVTNVERRQDKMRNQIQDATEKQYEQRDRNVRTSRSIIDTDTWLRNNYTNEDGQLVCQICKEEMPFRKRDGEYYFEGVEALSQDYFNKEHEAQFLCLCPLCAAMYKEFIKRDEHAMENVKNGILSADGTKINITLGALNTSVQFVESHLLDIKQILEQGDE